MRPQTCGDSWDEAGSRKGGTWTEDSGACEGRGVEGGNEVGPRY